MSEAVNAQTETVPQLVTVEPVTGQTSQESPDFIEERRRLIGPAADVTHPDFPRANHDNETFGISYQISKERLVQNVTNQNGRLIKVSRHVLTLTEIISDSTGNEIKRRNMGNMR